MNTTVNIRFGKKDSQLVEWWDEMVQKEYNISKTIHLAILYYIYTGKYLTIAKMKKSTEPNEGVSKKLYIQKDTEVYEWLSQKQEQRMSVSQIIRSIVKQSIEISQEENILIEIDNLILLVEQAKTNKSDYRNSNYDSKDRNESINVQTDRYKEKKYEEITIREPLPVKNVHSDYQQDYEETEEQGGPDIFDILTGGNKLVLQ